MPKLRFCVSQILDLRELGPRSESSLDVSIMALKFETDQQVMEAFDEVIVGVGKDDQDPQASQKVPLWVTSGFDPRKILVMRLIDSFGSLVIVSTFLAFCRTACVVGHPSFCLLRTSKC